MTNLADQIHDILRGEISAGAELIEGERNAAEKIATLVSAEIDRLRTDRDQYLKSAIDYGNLSERLRAALKPFADGADKFPDTWPDHRALLIDENHPDNPKPYSLLIARVTDFRNARAVLADQQTGAEPNDGR